MIRTLEIAWLCITVFSLLLTVVQFFREGWQCALWMLMISGISLTMYTIRKKQRIKFEHKDEKQLYH